jgi:hypothetical protein
MQREYPRHQRPPAPRSVALSSELTTGGIDKDARHVTQIHDTVDFGEDGAPNVEGGKGSQAIFV